MTPQTKSNKPARDQLELKSVDYERIGRDLELIVTAGYSKRRLFIANFLRGVFFGLGASVGLSIVLAVSIYVLSFLGDLPLLGDFFERIRMPVEDARTE